MTLNLSYRYLLDLSVTLLYIDVLGYKWTVGSFFYFFFFISKSKFYKYLTRKNSLVALFLNEAKYFQSSPIDQNTKIANATYARASQRKSTYRQLMIKKANAELAPSGATERKADPGSFRRASISLLQQDNKRPRKPSRSDKNSVKSPLAGSRSPISSLAVSNDSDDCFYSRTRAHDFLFKK